MGLPTEMIVFRITEFAELPIKEIKEEAYMSPGGTWAVKALK
jgi:hypothetical protein